MQADPYAECTVECERMPDCTTCGRRKQPVGRDAPAAGDHYCHGAAAYTAA
jgi:hypothetical protein